jgi:hypothetical protein
MDDAARKLGELIASEQAVEDKLALLQDIARNTRTASSRRPATASAPTPGATSAPSSASSTTPSPSSS